MMMMTPLFSKLSNSYVLALLALLLTYSASGQSADFDALKLRLTPYTLNDGAEFVNTTSYQYRALLRTSQQVGVDSFTDAKLIQYYALYSIFAATSAVPNRVTDADPRFVGIAFPTWLILDNWDQTTVDPCDGWHGVYCDDQGRVAELQLYENMMTGSFPPEIVLLALDGPFGYGAGNMYHLDLYGNEFLTNDDDSSWMTNLGSNMTTIIVEDTAFGGDIPRLPDNIVNFNIAGAYYTGGFDGHSFVDLNFLNYLNVDGNVFNRTVPAILATLPNLEYLYMSDTWLVGDLTPLEGMPAIVELWADGNPNIMGSIPASFGNMTTLQSLSLAYNSLTGTIPTELGQLTGMVQLWLLFNKLGGQIPTSLSALTKMKLLQLEANSFVGSMPSEVCSNTQFPLQVLETLGADCNDTLFACECCTCCDLLECYTATSK